MARILVREPRGRLSRPRWLFGARGGTLLAIALGCLIAWPFATGERTLVDRDVLSTHLPYKAFGAAQLAEGRVPASIPGWALGQPFAGNPNALPFYPGNLLYLALPFWSAFNLHYFLHLLLAFLGMRALARALGQGEAAAALAGLAYAGSGYLVTLLTFYNLLTVAAWTPVALAGLARGGRRGLVQAGLAAGMALLGGEPITAGLAVPAALLVACGAHGARRGLALAGGAAGIGIAVGLPQLVAAARVLPHSFRGAHGVVLEQVTANALDPWRLLELVLPLPWGVMSAPPPWGYWPAGLAPDPPYVFSLYVGVVALAVGLAAWRERRAWVALAAGSLVVAGLAGISAEATAAVTLGLFRFPQKLVFPFTLALAPLAGWGLEAALARPRFARWAGSAGTAIAVLGAALLLSRPAFATRLGETFAPTAAHTTLMTQAFLWSAQLVVAGLLLLGLAAAVSRRRAGAIVALQAVAVLQLLPLAPSLPTSSFAAPPRWAALLGPERSVVSVPSQLPAWEPRPPYRIEHYRPGARQERDRELLAPSFVLPLGISSPLAPDLDGLSAPLQVYLSVNLARADWDARVRWLRRLGAGALAREAATPGPALERIDARVLFGVPAELLRVPDPRPFAFRPRTARPAATPRDAYLPIARGEVADDVALVDRAVAHGERGEVRLVSATPDEIVLDVEGDGGVVGVLRATSPLWRAKLAGGTRLETVTVDLVLLGVEVPPGSQRVRLFVPRGAEIAAGAFALLAAAAALITGLRIGGDYDPADPRAARREPGSRRSKRR